MTLTGLYVPLITPFAADGTVALDTLEALAHGVLDAGATGLVALGTTAEPGALDAAERAAVLDVVAAVCAQRSAPLVVAASSADALAGLARRPGVGAALTVVPPFVRPGEEGALAHLARLAAGSPVPLVVYHVPYRTGQELSAPALRRLGELPGIAGIKYAPGAITADAVTFLGAPNLAVLCGDDALLAPMLALGASGAIAASAHLATAAFAELVAAWRRDHTARARVLGPGLTALARALFAEPNPTVIKAVLHAQGRLPTPAVRLPLLAGSAAARDAALRALDGLASLAESCSGQPATRAGRD